MSRYYPGFLAAFFIVLLRIAIGWHFLHEGVEKVTSTYGGKEPFSAEIYLRNANGPFAPYFRQMIPDVDSLAQLDPEHVKAEWTQTFRGSRVTSGSTPEQQKQAQTILDENLQWATYWFNDPANAEKLKKYEHDVHQAGAGRAESGGAVVPDRARHRRPPHARGRPPLADRAVDRAPERAA